MKTFFILLSFFAVVSAGSACDLHNVFASGIPEDSFAKGLHLNISEQFTDMSTLRQDGKKIHNETGQFLHSSNTRLLLQYNLNERLGIHGSVPIAYKSFQRMEGGAIESGNESGLGDISILGVYMPYQRRSSGSYQAVRIFGGVKMPTGSSDFLAEEVAEHHQSGARTTMQSPAEESGVHGHDVALGSGSIDGILGTELVGRWNRFYVVSHIQYFMRSKGDFQYRYANDLVWHLGPTCTVLTRPAWTLDLQASLSGESKGQDTLNGARLDDTSYTGVFAGPVALFRWNERFSGEAGVVFPVHIDNTGLQAVPSHRVVAGLSWHIQ